MIVFMFPQMSPGYAINRMKSIKMKMNEDIFESIESDRNKILFDMAFMLPRSPLLLEHV